MAQPEEAAQPEAKENEASVSGMNGKDQIIPFNFEDTVVDIDMWENLDAHKNILQVDRCVPVAPNSHHQSAVTTILFISETLLQ